MRDFAARPHSPHSSRVCPPATTSHLAIHPSIPPWLPRAAAAERERRGEESGQDAAVCVWVCHGQGSVHAAQPAPPLIRRQQTQPRPLCALSRRQHGCGLAREGALHHESSQSRQGAEDAVTLRDGLCWLAFASSPLWVSVGRA